AGHGRPQAVAALVDFERLEFTGFGLGPELRLRDLVEQVRVAGVGVVAEVDLGEAAALGRGADADEQEVRPGRRGAQPAGGQAQTEEQTCVHAGSSPSGRDHRTLPRPRPVVQRLARLLTTKKTARRHVPPGGFDWPGLYGVGAG